MNQMSASNRGSLLISNHRFKPVHWFQFANNTVLFLVEKRTPVVYQLIYTMVPMSSCGQQNCYVMFGNKRFQHGRSNINLHYLSTS